ncbi:uncharacterized protein LOC117119415 isoform X2 [Anneissia japonica]|uniref:uncharacterized protein LOC117119415 isoform X2 n=1 Tax=Anneissia japonica TaxID=1529436 RepID=UPI001425838A|nr:uncharacterized protein LOC117119415 isoform X2 [Anneissia japonica]
MKLKVVFLFSLTCLLVVVFLLISNNILTSRLVRIPSASRLGATTDYQQKCTPAKKIVFVKTHKTGSTTTATILERYGQKHSLVFALPKKTHIFSTTELFNRTMVTKIPRGITFNGNIINGYNILTNHARYNRPEMDAVIPNAKFVTILREPTTQLESAFAYFHLADGWGLENTPNAFEMFMKTPKAYFETPFFMSHLSLNAQLYDLGLDHQFHSDRFKVDYKIRQLENEFDLIMIMEYYDESLILLKQVLCLEYEDIIYIKKGERQQQNKYDISPKLREKMRRWNRNDARLYNHFNKTLWEKINANRKQFDKELKEFRKLQDEVTEKCVEHVTLNDGSTKRRIPLNGLKDEVRFCKRIFKGDGHFVKDLRQRYIELGLIKPQENGDGESNQDARYLQTQISSTCSPATQIVFIKTHKTGSTTVATMLQRYGKSHNLIFALPKIGHLFPIKDLFNRDMVVKIQTGVTVNGKTITGYNIITNHARYNRAEMDSVVPKAKFVTILREPVAQLESAFAYFDMADTFGLKNTAEPLVKFMEKPRAYMSQSYTNTSMVHLARNGQLYDLGLDPSLYKTSVAIRDKIREIDRGFDLVMIMEYFDESLVLLKNLLCLEFDDIVYIAKGARNDRYEMDPELRKSIRKWNFADSQLYEYFNKSLWNRIQKNRERFDKELMQFRIRQKEVTELCVKQYYTIDNELRNRIPPNRTEDENKFCKSLYAGDRNFVKRLRQEYIDLSIFDSTD